MLEIIALFSFLRAFSTKSALFTLAEEDDCELQMIGNLLALKVTKGESFCDSIMKIK